VLVKDRWVDPREQVLKVEGPRKAIGGGWGGGGERETNQIVLQESAYVPSSISKDKTLQEGDEHTDQQCRNDPLEVTNTAEKE
jgi:hypothetical protein